MKRCNGKCKELKEFSEFNVRNDSPDGFLNQCKSCVTIKVTARTRTKSGLVKVIYHSQKYKSKKRGHPMPTYTLEELRDWFRCHPLANALHTAWRLSGYRKGLKPSIDRKEDDKGYSMDNIQLMTWAENNQKHYDDCRAGVDTRNMKPVVQMTKQGEFIAEYHSGAEASRVTGVDRSSIVQCLKGRTKTSGKFKWKYKDIS